MVSESEVPGPDWRPTGDGLEQHRVAPLGAARGRRDPRGGCPPPEAGLRLAGGRARARVVCHGAGRGDRGSPGLPSWFRSPRHLHCPGAARPGPMYRALYAFRSAEPNALAFAAGETFLVLERSSAHWWLAARARSGETGYVPPAYLRRLQVSVPLPSPASPVLRLGPIAGSRDRPRSPRPAKTSRR